MPCLNEAKTVGKCVHDAIVAMKMADIQGEVIVADNGSTDGSQEIASAAGARVVSIAERGYGAALIGGIHVATSRYTIMGDADDSYDFSKIASFVSALREGNQLVMGNRFRGGISPRAMPLLHRYLGNPVLSALGRIFFRLPVGDFHCGLRGFETQAIKNLHLQSPGMEFATEMIAKASFAKLRVTEVPTTLRPDGRGRPPHLRTWRDGWRHLRFMMLFSPAWLFMGPGLFLLMIGLIGLGALWQGSIAWGSVGFDIHTMLFCSAAVMLGFQALQWGGMVQWLSVASGMKPPKNGFLQWLEKIITLEHALIFGFLLLGIGFFWAWELFVDWAATDFGAIDSSKILRQAIIASTTMVVGLQSIGGSLCAAALNVVLQGGFIKIRKSQKIQY
ncbi:glycosyltransferase family 2 protein [Delftia acidovorans]|uniref:glycosyltransferase family 2 protein n=1 Tax=Delftia acidovorans TaxID=80866 RepID=UPI001EDFBE65|nr:glycosyltransferase family 2 protein [Delftia acidovorans]MCG3780528.1 glycosyltransferase family 2 protein [Delftia acidovorans]